MALALHPFVIGQAFRLRYLDQALEYVGSHPGVLADDQRRDRRALPERDVQKPLGGRRLAPGRSDGRLLRDTRKASGGALGFAPHAPDGGPVAQCRQVADDVEAVALIQ